METEQAEDTLPPKEARRRERAERVAYILNHSIYCTFTDFFKPVINTLTDGYLSWLFPGCGHDHSGEHDHHDHTHDHHHHHHDNGKEGKLSRWLRTKRATQQAFSKERFMRYIKGEAIGDIGAIPLAIGLQDVFPKLVPAIRKITEPVMGPVFRMGAGNSAKKWAKATGVEIGSEAYQEKLDALYEYEMHHFPQAVLWTGSAIALNTGYQMWADRKSDAPFAKKLALKSSTVLSGMLITSGVVVGTRAMMPERMHNLDQSNVQKAILPVTKWTGKLFGVRGEDVDRMLEREQQKHDSWGERVEQHRLKQRDMTLAS